MKLQSLITDNHSLTIDDSGHLSAARLCSSRLDSGLEGGVQGRYCLNCSASWGDYWGRKLDWNDLRGGLLHHWGRKQCRLNYLLYRNDLSGWLWHYWSWSHRLNYLLNRNDLRRLNRLLHRNELIYYWSWSYRLNYLLYRSSWLSWCNGSRG